MRYVAGARQVLAAMASVEDQGGNHWWPHMLLAVVKLLPGPVLAHALSDGSVWSPQMRQQLRQQVAAGTLSDKTGVGWDGFIQEIEALASIEGSLVLERHVATVIARHRTNLVAIGVDPDRLVDYTAAREGSEFPEDALRLAALDSDAKGHASFIPATEAELTTEKLLAMDEREGSVEWKRSIWNHSSQPGALNSQETAAVALVNGNPGREVILVFWVDDDKTVVGQVTHDLKPLTDQQVRDSQRRLVERLQASYPRIGVSWSHLDHPGGQIVVARMRGRRRGTAVRTSYGAYPWRSGEDTFAADPATIAGWLAEEDANLQRIPEVQGETESRIGGLLTELLEGQRAQAARQRDELFARLEVVGSTIRGDASGSMTIRHRAGQEPGHRVQAWVLWTNGAVGVGETDWVSPGDQVDIELSPANPEALAAGPFADWRGLTLSPGEYVKGVFWRGLLHDTRFGRNASIWKEGAKVRLLADEWDESER